ncbi:unnamed protein product [Callosobruchus maculatus]|uniref:YLP motif-containing protein 1 n=1 Tax=Callosobruchus maculatus TaxID=64391 RepID=A0A653DLD1_CALMS|nr:unnamed protein product [Callosobruchus maculatus]
METSEMAHADPFHRPRRHKTQNVTIRLHHRQVFGYKYKGTHFHSARQFYQNVFPNFTVINVEKPPCFLRKFSPDGKHFIAFSADQTSLEIYVYRGPAAAADLLKDCEEHDDDKKRFEVKSKMFERFFAFKHRVNVAKDTEQLNRECSLFSEDGRYVIVGSASFIPEEIRPHFYEIYTNNESVTPNLQSPLEDYTLHLVDLHLGKLCDTRQFKVDKIYLSHNQGLYLYKDTLAVLSVQHQMIHVFQLIDGMFEDVRKIGRFCFETDSYFYNSVFPSSRAFRETAINSLKHRLLAFLYKRAADLSRTTGDPTELRKFFHYFDNFNSLKMWKMQLLDENHLLIKNANVYNETQFTCSPSNNMYARLLQKRFKQTIINAKFGGSAEATKRLLAQLPISAQSYTCKARDRINLSLRHGKSLLNNQSENMSWPAWPGAATHQSALLPTPVNPAPPVGVGAPPGGAAVNPMQQYSQEQWAQAQQQNWQQWAQWQQQYQQWHQQYGAEYQKSLTAMQTLGTVQPPLPVGLPGMAVAPQPPLPTENPPLPPDDAPKPQPPVGYTSAPPPLVAQDPYGMLAQQQQQQYGVGHFGIAQQQQQQQRLMQQQQQAQKRPYDMTPDAYQDPSKRPYDGAGANKPGQQWPAGGGAAKPPIATSTPTRDAGTAPKPNVEELSEAEKKFDKEFAAWEAQFNKWKEQNANHPDKAQYREYEKKWESWRNSLLERREQMRKKRLALAEAAKPPAPAAQPAPPPLGGGRQPPFAGGGRQPAPGGSQPRFGDGPPPTTQSQYGKPPPSYNNEPLDSFKGGQQQQPPHDAMDSGGGGDFLKTAATSGGGIPELDNDDPAQQQQQRDDAAASGGRQAQGPDFAAISKGINTILGDQKLLSMLSKVSQGQPMPAGGGGQPVLTDTMAGGGGGAGYAAAGVKPDYSAPPPSFQNFRGGPPSANEGYTVPPPAFDRLSGPPPPVKAGPPALMDLGGGKMPMPTQNDRFGAPPLDDRFGRPPPNDRFGGPPPDDRFGRPPPNDRFGGPPPNDRFGGPPPDSRFGGPPPNEKGGNFGGRDNFGGGGRGNNFGRNNTSFDEGNQNYEDYDEYNEDDDYEKYHEMFSEDDRKEDMPPRGGRNDRGGRFGPQDDRGGRFGQQDTRGGRFGQQDDRGGRFGPQDDRGGRFGQDARGGRFDPQDERGGRFGPQEERGGRFGPRDERGGRFGPQDERGGGGRFEPRDERGGRFEEDDMGDEFGQGPPPRGPPPLMQRTPLDLPPPVHEQPPPPPVKRIPYPQRPTWLAEAVKFIREFDPLAPKKMIFERVPIARYDWNPNDDLKDRRDDFRMEPRDRRHIQSYDAVGGRRGDRDRQNRRGGSAERNRNRYDDRREERDRQERNNDRYDRNDRNNRQDRQRRDSRRGGGDDRPALKKEDLEELSDDAMDDWEKDDHERSGNRRSASPSMVMSNPPNPEPVTPQETMIEDILNPPGRFKRPPRIVEQGGSAPRILSLDDYFMVEQERQVMEDGKTQTVKEMVYEYEADMEESYRTSLMKSFKKTVTDGYFPFIIVDNINDKVKHFGEMWSFAKQTGFQVYICQLDLDPVLCTKRNTHNRTEQEIEDIISGWEPTPAHHPTVDASSLLHAGGPIQEVEMEVEEEQQQEGAGSTSVGGDAAGDGGGGQQDEEKEEEEDVPEDHVGSKWDNFDCSLNNLAKLDGVSKPIKRSGTMEEYLRMEDEWQPPPVSSVPGKKRVRWADLEEQRQQTKMRAIGFVVGQTDWNRMMDPTMGRSALTRTKYIERANRRF